ncbi:cyclase family protein [Amycolatopsis sp. NPDC005232]|uniref:cyclase family protein n=1 Tax=Amycolatopsis sp. NPDC005232 TaxID=3157027 RepID=UPI0033B5EB81
MSDQPVKQLSEILSGAPTNWGRWGADDEIGALNLLGPKEVLAAAACLRQGRVFTLQTRMCDPAGDPFAPHRQRPVRVNVQDQGTWRGGLAPDIPGGGRFADDYLTTHVQGSTNYDALGHVWYDDRLFNGYDADSTIGGLVHDSILPIAEHGVVGRGVLIDLARHRGKRYLDSGETYTHHDLEAAAERQGVELRKRDILLVRTGRTVFFRETPTAEFHQSWPEPGLVYSPGLAEWFHEREIPNIGSDTIGVETSLDPETGAKLLVHSALMRNLGVLFLEICDLEDLAEDCAADGQWDFFYVAAPLKIVHATGGPVNPVAIK